MSSDEEGGTGDEEYEVEKIVASRVEDGVMRYKVRWRNFGPEDDTWEPINNLEDCPQLLVEYQQRKEERIRKKQQQQSQSTTGVEESVQRVPVPNSPEPPPKPVAKPPRQRKRVAKSPPPKDKPKRKYTKRVRKLSSDDESPKGKKENLSLGTKGKDASVEKRVAEEIKPSKRVEDETIRSIDRLFEDESSPGKDKPDSSFGEDSSKLSDSVTVEDNRSTKSEGSNKSMAGKEKGKSDKPVSKIKEESDGAETTLAKLEAKLKAKIQQEMEMEQHSKRGDKKGDGKEVIDSKKGSKRDSEFEKNLKKKKQVIIEREKSVERIPGKKSECETSKPVVPVTNKQTVSATKPVVPATKPNIPVPKPAMSVTKPVVPSHKQNVTSGKPPVPTGKSADTPTVRQTSKKSSLTAELNRQYGKKLSDIELAMFHAIEDNNIGLLRELTKSARLDKEKDNETPLMVASRLGRVAMVTELVAAGCNVNFANMVTNITALMKACAAGHLGVVQCLVESGAKVNTISSNGYSALLYAVEAKRLNVARYLLAQGADSLEAVPGERTTAIQVAHAAESQALETLVTRHSVGVMTAITGSIHRYVDGRAGLAYQPHFPPYIQPLRDSTSINLQFNWAAEKHGALSKENALLLFLVHARFTNGTIQCRLHGPCAVHTVLLNQKRVATLTQPANYILGLNPNQGVNHLRLELIKVPIDCPTILVTVAFKVALKPK